MDTLRIVNDGFFSDLWPIDLLDKSNPKYPNSPSSTLNSQISPPLILRYCLSPLTIAADALSSLMIATEPLSLSLSRQQMSSPFSPIDYWCCLSPLLVNVLLPTTNFLSISLPLPLHGARHWFLLFCLRSLTPLSLPSFTTVKSLIFSPCYRHRGDYYQPHLRPLPRALRQSELKVI